MSDNLKVWRQEPSFVENERKFIKSITGNDFEFVRPVPVTFETRTFHNNHENSEYDTEYTIYPEFSLKDSDGNNVYKGFHYMQHFQYKEYSLATENIHSSFNGVISGIRTYKNDEGWYYDINSFCEYFKNEDKAIATIYSNISKQNIDYTLYNDGFNPLIRGLINFTYKDTVKRFDFCIKGNHVRINNVKAFYEDIMIPFAKCVFSNISHCLNDDMSEVEWNKKMIQWQERLRHYTNVAAEQNSIKLNMLIEIEDSIAKFLAENEGK